MAKEGHVIYYKLKDMDGKVIHTFQMGEPLQFPYLIFNKKLYVTSRDEVGVLLERSYHVLMMQEAPKNAERH
jgi:hypothetical protein